MDLSTVLLLAALIIFGIAAWLQKSLIALGLAVWVLAVLLPRIT